jgi:hypothetical protein
MNIPFLVLMIGVVLVAGILLARRLERRNAGGYRRRFNAGTRHDGEAFPIASTLYLGDGGSASHSSHHSADCPSHSDGGGGCPDGGGGS